MTNTSFRKTRDWFERQCRAAERGAHLPTVNELLRLSPFINDDIESDIRAFAERMLPVIGKSTESQAIYDALAALSAAPWRELVDAAISAFQEAPMEILTPQRRAEIILRLEIYSAYLGNEAAISALAERCFHKSQYIRNATAMVDLIRASMGWQSILILRRAGLQFSTLTSPGFVRCKADEIFKIIGEHWQSVTNTPSRPDNECVNEPTPNAITPERSNIGVVVVSAIGNAGLAHAKDVENEFNPLLKKRLPLRKLPPGSDIRQRLSSEFPHAVEVLDTLLSEMAAGPYLRIRPTVLLGAPGVGKTRFCQRLMSALEVPHAVFSCGGVSDSSLAGTARRWSTGEPSLPLSLVRQHKVGNPCIVLDEMDKVGTARHNGNLHDALLGLLEQQSALRWFDPYLQAPVNLFCVIWLGTANSLEDWSGPLRDRVRILKFPSPRPEHLEALSGALLEQIAAERGQDSRWVSPLTGHELDALRSVWPGGSVRKLRRYLEGVLAARETAAIRQ